MTGECYEINSFFIDRFLKRHEPKIHIFAHVADESSGYRTMPGMSDSSRKKNTVEGKYLSVLDNLAEKDIMRLIQELSPGYRTVFNLYVVEGYTHKEIGDMLNISEGTSKSQLSRAKVILQDMVKKYLEERNR